MALTPAGRRLLIQAEQIIGAVRHLANAAQDLRGQPTGILKLGTVLDPAVLRVGELIRALERYPHIEVELHQMMSSDIVTRVRNGTLDAGFFFGPAPDDLDSIALRDLGYGVSIPAAWAPRLLPASWETVAQQPWIVAPEPSSPSSARDGFVPRRHPPAHANHRSRQRVGDQQPGRGRDRRKPHSRRDRRPIDRIRTHRHLAPRKVTTKLWLVHSPERVDDPVIAALCDTLRDVWKLGDGAAAARNQLTAPVCSALPANKPTARTRCSHFVTLSRVVALVSTTLSGCANSTARA